MWGWPHTAVHRCGGPTSPPLSPSRRTGYACAVQHAGSTPKHTASGPHTPVRTLEGDPHRGESVYGNDYWFRVGQGGQMGFVHKEFIVPDGYVEHC